MVKKQNEQKTLMTKLEKCELQLALHDIKELV